MPRQTEPNPLRISVVVPTYGRPDRVRTLLERLDAQTLPAERFEVIVVDDGTPEPIAVDPTRHRYALQLHRQDNAGPAAARNLGLRHCRAELVIFFNDDAVPADDLLAVHVQAHETGPEKCAVLGTFTFTQDSLREPFTQLLADSDLLFDFVRLRHGEKHGWGFFWTCNVSLPKSALVELGGFDARTFQEAIVEDVELGYRLEKAGWSVVFRSDARCEHQHPLTVDDYFRREVRRGVNTVRMWKKHRDPSILNQRPGTCIEDEYVRGLQMKVEKLLEPHRRLVEMMRRRSNELRGQEWPQQERAHIVRLVRDLSCVPFARGALIELTGRDPLETIETVAKGVPTDKSVSIIACSYNALEKTKACVESMRRTVGRDRDVEILFVDNGSIDGSAEWLAGQPDLVTVRNTENRGAPAARNQALALARGDYLVFLDNDIVLTPEWLERLIHHVEVDPRSGCVAACADRASHRQDVPYEGPFDFDSVCDVARVVARRHHRESRPAITMASFLMIVRRSVVDAIGGFDEAFSPWGFEDDDYTLRAHAAGFWNRIALDVFVHHDTYVGPKLERHTRLLDENWRRFARKWKLGDADHGDMRALADAATRTWPREALVCELSTEPTPADFEARRRQAVESWRATPSQPLTNGGTSPVARLEQAAFDAATRARRALQEGRDEEASNILREALRGGVNHPDLSFVTGLVAERRALRAVDARACDAALHEAATAYDLCTQFHARPWVGETTPGVTSWAAWTRLGTVRLLQGRDEDASSAFATALRTRPDDVEAVLGACEARLHGADAGGVLANLQELLKAPEPDAWILAAYACASTGNLREATLLVAAARERVSKRAPIAPHRLQLLSEVEAAVLDAPGAPRSAAAPTTSKPASKTGARGGA